MEVVYPATRAAPTTDVAVHQPGAAVAGRGDRRRRRWSGSACSACWCSASCRAEYEQRALAMARSVATSDELRALVAGYSADDRAGPGIAGELADGPVQRRRRGGPGATGALFVVVTDDRGIRLAHPQPDALGRMVSTDPSIALAGAEEIVEQPGTLGPSARAKVPVFAPGTDPARGRARSASGSRATRSPRRWGPTCRAWPAVRGRRAGAGRGRVGAAEPTVAPADPGPGAGGDGRAGLRARGGARRNREAVFAVDRDGRITVANDEARRLFGPAVRPGRRSRRPGCPTGCWSCSASSRERPHRHRPTDRTPAGRAGRR